MEDTLILITRCLEEVSDWLNKTDDILAQHSQSQSQIVPLHDNDVEILLSRFFDILQLKPGNFIYYE